MLTTLFSSTRKRDAAEIKRLQDLLFSMGAMKEAPCFCCGYNGPDYYNPAVHPCAKRHHAAEEKGSVTC